MEITKAHLEARRAELLKMQTDAGSAFDRCNGAILDIDHWLAQLEAEAPPAAPSAPIPFKSARKRQGK